MRYCQRCVYPANHPFGLGFDERGLCLGCLTHEEKDRIDWASREEELSRILAEYADPSELRHDCIVPVTGGRDSFFIVDLLKNRFGLNPLLVTFNRHYNTAAGIFNLERLRTRTGCDIVTMTLAPERMKTLIRFGLERRGSIHWPYLAGSTVFPVQIAVRRRIPLIVWGAHQGVDQTGMFSHDDRVEMTRRYRREHDLMGLEPEDAAGDLDERDIAPLFYPDDRDLAALGVRGIYLNNYIRWDTKAQHERMLETYDYCTGLQARTFDTYSDPDCRIHSSLHDAIKFRKWGYGRIADHAAREIRFGRLTREQAIEWIGRCDMAGEGDAAGFAAWIGIDEAGLWSAVDRHRDPAIWDRDGGTWRLKDSILNHRGDPGVDALRLAPPAGPMVFRETRPSGLTRDPGEPRLLMRGWSD